MTWNLFCDHSKRREDWERSIFVRLKEGGYRLRENILFHLYVSTSPCGDARLNSPYEITTNCKKNIYPPFFSLLCGFFFFFFLFLLRLVFSLLAENISHYKLCGLCVSVQLMLGHLFWGMVQGKSGLGWARQCLRHCSMCLRPSGSASECNHSRK